MIRFLGRDGRRDGRIAENADFRALVQPQPAAGISEQIIRPSARRFEPEPMLVSAPVRLAPGTSPGQHPERRIPMAWLTSLRRSPNALAAARKDKAPGKPTQTAANQAVSQTSSIHRHAPTPPSPALRRPRRASASIPPSPYRPITTSPASNRSRAAERPQPRSPVIARAIRARAPSRADRTRSKKFPAIHRSRPSPPPVTNVNRFCLHHLDIQEQADERHRRHPPSPDRMPVASLRGRSGPAGGRRRRWHSRTVRAPGECRTR